LELIPADKLNKPVALTTKHMLTEKYKPKKVKDVIGNPKAVEAIKVWAKQWKTGKKQKPLLLHGPPGVGKTSVVYALAHDMNWTVVELNSANKRSKEKIEDIIGESSTVSLWGGYRLILIDDVDQMSGREDRGAMNAVSTIIKEANNPVILTALDYWNQKISSLRKIVEPVEFRKVNSRSIAKYLKTIAKNENIELSESRLEKILENINGDLRAALNDLEGMSSGHRDTEINVFEVMRTIFKKTDYQKIRQTVLNATIDYDLLTLWILENIPNEYEKNNDIARAYNYLSRSDIFRKRIIRQQYWGYLRYVTDLMSCGVAVSKKEPYHKFVRYRFPTYLSKMSRTRSARSNIKSISQKIGKLTHDSTKDVRKYLWLFNKMIKHGGLKEMIQTYDFEKKEIEFLKKQQ